MKIAIAIDSFKGCLDAFAIQLTFINPHFSII